MANALALFEPSAVPDHIREFLEGNSNIPPSDRVPTLSIKGKVFTINIGGEATKIMKKNEEGEEEPVNILPVVILASNEKRGREFYDGDYNPEATAAPVCWSNDSIAPDASITEPKASKCAKCPLSVKGSKVDRNGNETVACREFRLIAVVPAHDLTFEPLRMKLPITSDFDGRNKEAQAKGWFGFRNYVDLLRAKGYKDTRALSTKLRFDPSSEWPKVQFSPGKWLSPEALAQAKEISETDNIKELLKVTYTQRAETEDEDKTLPKSDDDDDAPITLKPNGKPPAPTSRVTDDDDDEDGAEAMRKAEAAKKKQVEDALKQKAVAEHTAKVEADKAAKAKTNGAAKPAAPVADDDDEDAIIAAAMAKKKAKEAAAKAAQEAATKAAPKASAKGTTKAPVAEPDDDDPPPTSKVAGKPKADAPATKPVVVSPAVAGVLGAWADDDDE